MEVSHHISHSILPDNLKGAGLLKRGSFLI